MNAPRFFVNKFGNPVSPVLYHDKGSNIDRFAACKEAVPAYARYKDRDLGIWLVKMPVRRQGMDPIAYDDAVFREMRGMRGVVWAGD